MQSIILESDHCALTITLNELYEIALHVTDYALQDKIIAKRDELQSKIDAMRQKPSSEPLKLD